MKDKVNYVKISFRNLGRHKAKTITTIAAISFCVFLYIVIDAWVLGYNLESQRNLINYETGAAKIYSKAYYENKEDYPLYEGFTNYEPILQKLDQNGYNSAIHAVFTGSLRSFDNELPFMFVGIDPEKEKTVFGYHKYLEKDSKFVENGKFEVVIGIKGAKNLNVKTGDEVTAFTIIDKRDEYGNIRHINQIIDLTIAGIVNSPNPKTNFNIVYLPLDILQDEMGILLENHITEICVRDKQANNYSLPGKKESPQYLRKILQDTLPDNLIITSWQENALDYIAQSKSDKFNNYIIIVIFFILALVSIINTMLIVIYDRIKEIGILSSLGMDDAGILRLFLTEAGLMGLIGTLIGIVFAILMNFYMVKYGVDFSYLMEQADMSDVGFRIVGIYRSVWNWHTIIGSVFVVTMITVLAALLPALKTVKLNVVDILHYE